MSQITFEKVFHSVSERDKFLSRLFGIFNEEIVRIWCRDPHSPYKDLGRPTVRLGEGKYTLDFTLQSRQSGDIFVGELKCELEFQNYKYLTLNSPSQFAHHDKEAFRIFLDFASNSTKYLVTTSGKRVNPIGSVLVWGSVTEDGRKSIMKEQGIYDILSLEEIIADLVKWDNHEYRLFIEERLAWCQYLFNALTVKT